MFVVGTIVAINYAKITLENKDKLAAVEAIEEIVEDVLEEIEEEIREEI